MNFLLAIEDFVCDSIDFFSKSTLITYEYYIRYFLRHFPEIRNVEDVTKDILNRWKSILPKLITKRAPNGSKPATLKLSLDALEAFYDYLVDEEVIFVNPVASIQRPTLSWDPPKVIDSYSLYKLREALNLNLRDRSILSVFEDTGIRVSELVNLKRSDYDPALNEINVYSTKSNENRTVYLTFQGAIRLNTYLSSRQDNSPYLFVNRQEKCLSTHGVRNMLKVYCYNIFAIDGKLEKHKIIHPHDLRRTFATDLYNRGMSIEDISRLLGHKHIVTTERYIGLSSTSDGVHWL